MCCTQSVFLIITNHKEAKQENYCKYMRTRVHVKGGCRRPRKGGGREESKARRDNERTAMGDAVAIGTQKNQEQKQQKIGHSFSTRSMDVCKVAPWVTDHERWHERGASFMLHTHGKKERKHLYTILWYTVHCYDPPLARSLTCNMHRRRTISGRGGGWKG